VVGGIRMLRFPVAPKAQQPPLRIEPFKGINLSVTPTQIDNSQSPDMLNVHTDERGALTKRTGYERVFPKIIGDGPINGLFSFRKINGTEKFLISHGEKLYTTVVMDATWEEDDLEGDWGD
jgi:hypothetical protein